ncbi:uncharacterized protein LOC128956909 [Oppia nitens]|uniref:uncharacterized protein LOC128956909 n=1 Tax=Oppia nitens TaxID=1686743 RepID=UPI0023D9D816|nr:uncharacterized protein LOC128956909 [Oppia nitens]XP_054158601.1 uncharacterized protein LOC128956909 [Oppia nitens]
MSSRQQQQQQLTDKVVVLRRRKTSDQRQSLLKTTLLKQLDRTMSSSMDRYRWTPNIDGLDFSESGSLSSSSANHNNTSSPVVSSIDGCIDPNAEPLPPSPITIDNQSLLSTELFAAVSNFSIISQWLSGLTTDNSMATTDGGQPYAGGENGGENGEQDIHDLLKTIVKQLDKQNNQLETLTNQLANQERRRRQCFCRIM